MNNKLVLAATKPFIRFCLRDKRLFIGRSTIDLLGNMPYTGFQWSMPTRSLKLYGMREETDNAVRITRHSGCEYVFQRAVFSDGILLFMGWDKQLSYKVRL
ncbi:hypothetical protein AGMMS49992_31130 [Clostridia bacterium]|nr:hypothetical protein AGMMS49992_31130 [Clostridia bacterium]